jgi:2-amino-4-hydroxy-6-hydroxymethyldihydropteridine diphosphokinase
MTTPVAVGLGSNLGDRRAHLAFAIEQLRLLLGDLRVSAVRETEPVGTPDVQPRYLNAVAVGRTALEPPALLAAMMAIERARGRSRPSAGAARTLDLDLILFGDRLVDTPALIVPHPRFRDRQFVLEPLAEVAPDWRDPVSGLTVRELLARLVVKAT